MGFVLNKHYIVGRMLGHGGFGITYLTYDTILSRCVAAKEFFPFGLSARRPETFTVTNMTGDMLEAFQRGKEKFFEEARSLAGLAGHPNIVTIHDFFEGNGTAYFVMTYYEGCDFSQYLKNTRDKLSFPETMRLLSPIMNALDY
ncbi:MAG: protein kinase, partial [Synergistaceae bacterium]|nr:protein kinase [Synergistaceae bacterium]